ncbi:MAG TPA: TIM-barrel domain-containing protein [Acidobacteriaceae bacterium]|nr:TIM-barrel domain-containing protein [Acidobacteriaceae bacterium]
MGRAVVAMIGVGLLVGVGGAWAQDVEEMPGATRVVRAAEGPVDGLVKRDADTVAFALPGVVAKDADGKPVVAASDSAGVVKDGATAALAELLVHDFDFNGEPVRTDKIHLRQVAPGVVEITSVAWEVGYWRFHVRDGASYYGLGERFDTLDHAHTVVENLSIDNKGVKGASAYKPIPFFMSTTGYGLWVDTTGEATFDMNASDEREIAVDVTAAKLRIVLFAGPQFPGILERFTALAGRAVVPPYWAFAPWKGRDFHQNEAQVKEDVDRNRELGLPASVILIDSPWAETYNDYKFNPKQFEDAPGMVKYIHEQGYKLVLWHTSWINSKSDAPKEAGFEGKIAPLAENYQFAADQNLFVKNADGSPWVGRWWKGEGSLIDFTYPKAKQWWQDQVRLAIAAGADGFKDDDAEGAFFGDGVKFYDGTDPRVMRNRYGVLYNNAVEELVQKDLKGNGVLFARSVSVGANGIGFLWGGDNEASFSKLNGLPSVVTAGLGAGLSGMPLWAADLGGYEGLDDTPNARLLERWTEYAAFSPVMEVMSSKNISPWNFDSKSAEGSHEALDIYRKHAVLHMSLFPYRYAAAQEAAKTGMPMMRALVLNWQDDRRARDAKDEYMFGPDFLVAPVVDEGTQRAVYLPAGAWVDYWTGKAESGGKVVVADAAVDTIPVWVRAGAVISKIPEDVMTLVPAKESGNAAIKTLDDRRVYEVVGSDDVSMRSTDFEGRVVTHDGRTLKIAGGPAARVTVRWRFGAVREATVDGKAVAVHNGADGPYVEFAYAAESVVAWQ